MMALVDLTATSDAHAGRGRSALMTLRRLGVGPILVVAGAYVAAVVLCAVFAPLIAPQNPGAQDIMLGATGPSRSHLLGTNELGQDTLSRLVYGSRTALVGPLIVAVVSTCLALAIGIAAAYFGGRIDVLTSRAVDVAMSIPVLLVALVVVGVVGGGYLTAVALLSIAATPATVRLVRSSALEQRGRPYIEAAEGLGLPSRTVMFRHLLPNVAPVAIASGFLVFAFSLVILSSLAFLGLGVGINTPDWGRMLAMSQSLIFRSPSAVIAPGVALVLLAACMTLIGDWIHERIAAGDRR